MLKGTRLMLLNGLIKTSPAGEVFSASQTDGPVPTDWPMMKICFWGMANVSVRCFQDAWMFR